jgi:hypothetical protein
MLNTKLKLTLGLAVLAAVTALAQTQTAAPAASTAPPPSAFDQWVKEVKNPTDWITWGADLRLREEYLDNSIRLGNNIPLHELDYFRFRGRVWTTVTPVTNLAFNARLAAEPREWMTPATSYPFSPKPYAPSTANSGMEWRYGIVDTLNVKWDKIFDQPFSITAGRQDIMLGDPGDWWLVADGTPNDGSWTMYFDSMRMTYTAKPVQTTFDAIYIYQSARPGDWIPTLGRSSGYYVTEQNEQGVVLYASNKSLKNVQVDGYFIYKHDDRVSFPTSNGDNANIFTIGSKITGTPAEHWFYSVEGAYQFGQKQDATVQAAYVNANTDWREIAAYAGKAKLTYLFKDPMNNQVSLVGEFLSGDDPNTKNKDEMFDILWGRYPRWSEAMPFYYANETSGRMGQMNNLGRIGASWSITPVKDTTFTAMYNALLAPESIPTRDMTTTTTEQFSRNGNFRGHYVQTVLKHQFSKHVSGYVMGEGIWQGDYYTQHELMTFIRAEINLTF